MRGGILTEAAQAFPAECCGLLEGHWVRGAAHITRLHRAHNIGAAPDRFEIDPVDHFAALKTARMAGAAIIGCYHSHPGGKPKPSAIDLAGAGENNFVWLIAAGAEIAAFVYDRGVFTGADLVTSSS
jgi:proteasome lid subunit RPN8/RPN11